MSLPSCYMLVVKTNQYTGNFERELCGFATGTWGECEVGRAEAEEEFLEAAAAAGYNLGAAGEEEPYSPFESLVLHVPDDDDGCRRPVSIWCTNQENACEYHELAIFLEDEPALEDLAFITERILAFPAYHDPVPEPMKPGERRTQQHRSTPYLKIESIKLIKHEVRTTDTVITETTY